VYLFEFKVINSNISEVKLSSPDYKGVMNEEQARQDFLRRIENYRVQYEQMDEVADNDLSFIKVINAGVRFVFLIIASTLYFHS
jgi:hypothetical protein